MTFETIREKLKGKYFDYEVYCRKQDTCVLKKINGGIFCDQEITDYYLMKYTRYYLFCKSNRLHNMYTKNEFNEICSNKKLLVLIIDDKTLKVC